MTPVHCPLHPHLKTKTKQTAYWKNTFFRSVSLQPATMERHLYLTLVELLHSSINGKSCWSKMVLCLSSSFFGAVLTVYYLLPASYSVHQLLTHHNSSKYSQSRGWDDERHAGDSAHRQHRHSLLEHIFRTGRFRLRLSDGRRSSNAVRPIKPATEEIA